MVGMVIRPFSDKDAPAVQGLFVTVNRLLAPPHLAAQFEAYIALSLREEIHRICQYYDEREGGFWVAEHSGAVIGMLAWKPLQRE